MSYGKIGKCLQDHIRDLYVELARLDYCRESNTRQHGWTNVGFTSIIEVCKDCGQDKENYMEKRSELVRTIEVLDEEYE